MVSILVLLDDSHQAVLEKGARNHHEVSILVLLDDSHQAIPSSGTDAEKQGFNPCSSG